MTNLGLTKLQNMIFEEAKNINREKQARFGHKQEKRNTHRFQTMLDDKEYKILKNVCNDIDVSTNSLIQALIKKVLDGKI